MIGSFGGEEVREREEYADISQDAHRLTSSEFLGDFFIYISWVEESRIQGKKIEE